MFIPFFSFFGSTLNFYVVAQLSVIVCMFVLLSSITRPGCRDCSRSAAQSEVSHRAKPARPDPPTNRRRTQPTRRPTNRDVVNCHPVQAILASPSLPLRYTPVDHSCSFLCQVPCHEYLELRESSLSPFMKHCDDTDEKPLYLHFSLLVNVSLNSYVSQKMCKLDLKTKKNHGWHRNGTIWCDQMVWK